MKRALISVSDKRGVVDFAKSLQSAGYEIISTGGTYKALQEAGVAVIQISDITKFPEMLDGRVKTLHPAIHGGLLARRDLAEHRKTVEDMGIGLIDVVAVNLYPFKETIRKEGVALEEAVENIDIGGPSMLRSAAKNFRDVCVIVDPEDYSAVSLEIMSRGKTSYEINFRLAAKAFAHTAAYDAMISSYLFPLAGIDPMELDSLTLTYEKAQDMRYGENPHQKAAFYREIGDNRGFLSAAKQLQGKELSFNNINDAHGALELVKEFDKPAVVASKHSNPCGVGEAEDIFTAWTKAYSADPVSVFGGIIACNREVDGKTAGEMVKIYLEIIIAPSFSEEALSILAKKKNLRLLELPHIERKQPETALDIKKVSGGLLAQTVDGIMLDSDGESLCVTERKPTPQEMKDMLFTWKIVKYAKSNGIAIGKDGQSLGVGPGQVNRIWATKQAIEHCVETLGADILKGSVLASDAYFPFDDCVEAAAAAGITAIIQPGGSKNDQLSIDACNHHGLAMVFTGVRHFRH